MRKRILIALGLILVLGISNAQSLDKAKFDSLFQVLETNNKFMGSVILSENGKPVYEKFIGKADIETGKKNGPETKYRIGSVTKMFTACLVLKAIEEGKLTLNQTIDRYFPSVKNAEKITIDNLLHQRSGIRNFTSNEDFADYYTEPKSRKEMVEIIAKGQSDFEPGSSYEYSNSNYVLLSYILEEIYHKPYREILDEKIIQPSGLKHTYTGHPTNVENNEAYSYSWSGKWIKEKETDMSIAMGAGSIISNPGDMTTFIENLFAGKIINAKSLELMLEIKDNYGLGIVPFHCDDKEGFGHSGAIDGSTSALYYFPADKLTIAIASNGNVLGTKYLLQAVAAIYFHKDFELPVFKTIVVSPEELDSYAGVYSCPELPQFTITISKDSLGLLARGSGEPAIPMDATEKNKFEFLRAGIKLEFKPAENQMIYSQGGSTFIMTRDKQAGKQEPGK